MKFIILILFLASNLLLSCQKKTKKDNYTAVFESWDLKNGDIVLRQGEGLVSWCIAKTLDDSINLSHCGIISIDSLDNIWVIHTMSQKLSDYKGVHKIGFEEFIMESENKEVWISRVRDKGLCMADEIEKTAQYYLKIQKPFDEEYLLNDSSAFFCSELIFRCIEKAEEVCRGSNSFNKHFKTESYPRFTVLMDSNFFYFEKKSL